MRSYDFLTILTVGVKRAMEFGDFYRNLQSFASPYLDESFLSATGLAGLAKNCDQLARL